MPVGADNTMAPEPKLNGALGWRSEGEQIHEALEPLAQLPALFWLELAQQCLFKLAPVIGKAIADAHAAFAQGNASSQLRPDGLTRDQTPFDQARQPGRQAGLGQAEFGGQFALSGAGTGQLKQNGVVTRLKATFGQGQQQRAMRQLARLDEPIERGAG